MADGLEPGDPVFSLQTECPHHWGTTCEEVDSETLEGWINQIANAMGSEADPSCFEGLDALNNAALQGGVFLAQGMDWYAGGIATIGEGFMMLNGDHFGPGPGLSSFNEETVLHEALHNAGHRHADLRGDAWGTQDWVAQHCFGRARTPWPTV